MGLFDRFRGSLPCPLCGAAHIDELQTKAFYNPYLRDIRPGEALPDEAEMYIEKGWIASGTSCPHYTGRTPREDHRWLAAKVMIEDGVWSGDVIWQETTFDGTPIGDPMKTTATPSA